MWLHAGFYFAVQSGGSFDIDFSVTDPDDVSLLEGNNERQGDYIFTANKVSIFSRIRILLGLTFPLGWGVLFLL
jgi:hypothetical protein